MTHLIWPEGPECDENCPGESSQWHDGYAWGTEKAEQKVSNLQETIDLISRDDVVTLDPDEYYRLHEIEEIVWKMESAGYLDRLALTSDKAQEAVFDLRAALLENEPYYEMDDEPEVPSGGPD